MTEADDDDPRLAQIAHEYEAALKSGRRPRKEEFLSRCPEQRPTLAAALEGLDFLHAAGPRLHRVAPEHELDPGVLPPLGDFRLLKEIGRGGMGVVYEATQLSLGRRVAVKVLPFAAALDGKQLQRFRNEAQAAAQLHHTNIVPVFAVGCERGVHFYAMQLIDGQPLSAVIRELRWLEGKGKPDDAPSASGSTAAIANRLVQRAAPDAANSAGADTAPAYVAMKAGSGSSSPTTSLGGTAAAPRGPRFFRLAAQLASQAADALDHAHQMGVVHRDVKPANLLVDALGNLWVTDFGLAQFHAEGNLTRTGDLVGTLRYMAPEQAGGQGVLLDQRTDVYGLGATLYELLALEPALPGKTRPELLRQLHDDDPKPLRQHDARIPLELETIVMKALAKNPAERYRTARALADDLRNFLADRPIVARRPALRDRAAKWLRRHRPVVRTALALLVASAGALGFAFAGTHRALERERASRAEAEENLQKARDAVALLTRVADELGDDNPMMLDARRRIYESALRYYEGFIEDSRDNPQLSVKLETSRARAQHILLELSAIEASYKSVRLGSLLRQESVQRELGLDDAARTLVGSVAAAPRFIGNRDALQKRAEEWDRALQALSKPQRQRLNQVALQQGGVFAWTDAEVAKELELSAAQQETVRKLQREFRPGPPPGGRGGGGRGRESNWAELRDALLQRGLAELTPAQRGKWQALTGPPFAFDFRPWQ